MGPERGLDTIDTIRLAAPVWDPERVLFRWYIIPPQYPRVKRKEEKINKNKYENILDGSI
jgi:hypothetical protein